MLEAREVAKPEGEEWSAQTSRGEAAGAVCEACGGGSSLTQNGDGGWQCRDDEPCLARVEGLESVERESPQAAPSNALQHPYTTPIVYRSDLTWCGSCRAAKEPHEHEVMP